MPVITRACVLWFSPGRDGPQRIPGGPCRVGLVVVLAAKGSGVTAMLEDDVEPVIQAVLPATAPASGAGPIEPDEILDLHLLLKDFEGSLDELLKAPHRSR
mgnify:CR=1 FL=1